MTPLTPVEDVPSSQDARGTFPPLRLKARLVVAAAVAVLASSQLANAQPESRIGGVIRDATAAGDELALLSFDQERGTRARVGFLINQPRTSGISTRLDF